MFVATAWISVLTIHGNRPGISMISDLERTVAHVTVNARTLEGSGQLINVRSKKSMLSRTEFNQALQRLSAARSKGDLTNAFSEIEMILREGNDEMKGESLLYGGEIKAGQGGLVDAKQDWLSGLDYASPGTFLRYCLERNIGRVCETLGLPDEAIVWHRKAATTCYRGAEFSGLQALTALLALNGGQVPPEDNMLFGSVIEKSWRVLQLPGAPDLNDLAGSVSKLAEGFRNLVEETKKESDRSAN